MLLPDGTVLVVGGGRKDDCGRPVFSAELYHPAAGTWTAMAAQQAPRMYHSTAVLLPDGRGAVRRGELSIAHWVRVG